MRQGFYFITRERRQQFPICSNIEDKLIFSALIRDSLDKVRFYERFSASERDLSGKLAKVWNQFIEKILVFLMNRGLFSAIADRATQITIGKGMKSYNVEFHTLSAVL